MAATRTPTTTAGRAMATATSSRAPGDGAWRSRPAIAIAGGAPVARSPCPGARRGRRSPRSAAAAAPARWAHVTLPNGTAVLSYPPSLRPLAGDKVAVSAARRQPSRHVPALPQRHAPARHREPAALGRVPAAPAAVRRRGVGPRGRRRPGRQVPRRHRVLRHRRYVTQIGAHHYEEIACLVQGRTSASVIVAAAPAAQWAQARPLLFRAVAAYSSADHTPRMHGRPARPASCARCSGPPRTQPNLERTRP